MLKKEIRKEFRKKRDSITESERMRWDDLLLIQFQTVELPFLEYLLSFYPLEEKREVNSFILTDFLRFRNPNLSICYPKTNTKHHTMDAVVCHPDSIFEANEWNIPEPVHNDIVPPQDLDLVLIPLLAFDEQGTRVGYGKGYYDRFLKDCREDCLKVGFSYYGPVKKVEDTDPNDIPLNLCITPQEVYVF